MGTRVGGGKSLGAVGAITAGAVTAGAVIGVGGGGKAAVPASRCVLVGRLLF